MHREAHDAMAMAMEAQRFFERAKAAYDEKLRELSGYHSLCSVFEWAELARPIILEFRISLFDQFVYSTRGTSTSGGLFWRSSRVILAPEGFPGGLLFFSRGWRDLERSERPLKTRAQQPRAVRRCLRRALNGLQLV